MRWVKFFKYLCYVVFNTVLWSFQAGGTKLERFLHSKNQYAKRKLLNFEFWINGELSKIGHIILVIKKKKIGILQ